MAKPPGDNVSVAGNDDLTYRGISTPNDRSFTTTAAIAPAAVTEDRLLQATTDAMVDHNDFLIIGNENVAAFASAKSHSRGSASQRAMPLANIDANISPPQNKKPRLAHINNCDTASDDATITDASSKEAGDIGDADNDEQSLADGDDIAVFVETEIVDWEKESKLLDDMFEEQAREKLANLPDLEMPRQFRPSVELFQHQIDGIRWLAAQEQGRELSPFVRKLTLKNGTVAHYCRLTRRRLHVIEPVQGSILADGTSHKCSVFIFFKETQTPPLSHHS